MYNKYKKHVYKIKYEFEMILYEIEYAIIVMCCMKLNMIIMHAIGYTIILYTKYENTYMMLIEH